MLRLLLHRLTHHHIQMTKDDVAEIMLCRQRWQGRMDLIVVTALPHPGQGPWHLPDITPELAEVVFAHNTPAGMLGVLTELGAQRRPSAH
ncbi:hypothetical protein Q2K19_22360 [Micromonospora soli]|uniref:hypothetical protein n=1 Tax=Micromonospora sp. NBRC 110009 TaxID=3061627 RepID=UPI00267225FE|nr:hypothetical protein [Micromonospora sp. NBRC 110009]WKT96915.1 hypothetical protein Q2K19_22360 [Micromonospora sp. NBRC 110009]